MAKVPKSRIALAAALSALLVYHLIIRPRSFRWEATPKEVRQAFPGDGLVPNPMRGTTRSITIDAPAAVIWPWLVQMGFGRASWYTTQFLEKGLRGLIETGLLNPDYYRRYKAQWKPNADRVLHHRYSPGSRPPQSRSLHRIQLGFLSSPNRRPQYKVHPPGKNQLLPPPEVNALSTQSV